MNNNRNRSIINKRITSTFRDHPILITQKRKKCNLRMTLTTYNDILQMNIIMMDEENVWISVVINYHYLNNNSGEYQC